jgi:hypothetical protein
VAGKFDDSGLAEGMIDWHTLGTVQRLRINIQSNHQNWVVMSEVVQEDIFCIKKFYHLKSTIGFS